MDTDSTGGAAAVQLDATSYADTVPGGRSPSPAAYVAGAVSAVLLAAGGVAPVVEGVPRGYASVPLLVVLAVAPMVVVAVLAVRGRHQAAAGVLAAVAALAPGRLVLDLILLTDPLRAARPELFRLHALAEPATGAGLWLLLAGHVVAIAAGVLAIRAVAPSADASWPPPPSAAAEAVAAKARWNENRPAAGRSAPAEVLGEPGASAVPASKARHGVTASLAHATDAETSAGVPATSSSPTEPRTAGSERTTSGGPESAAGGEPTAAGRGEATGTNGGPAAPTAGGAGRAATNADGGERAATDGPAERDGARSRAGSSGPAATVAGEPGPGTPAWPEAAQPAPARRSGLILGLAAAVVAAVGLMMAPFASSDAFLPAAGAFEGPGLVLAGSLLLAFALPVATVLLAGSGSAVARGGLLGLGVTAAVVGLPNLVAGLSLPGVRLSAGPILVLVGAAGMIAAAFLPTAAADAAPDDSPDGSAGEITLPGIRRLRIVTGALAVLTAAAAVAGALTPQVVVTGNFDGPPSPSRWALLAAGLLVGVLGLVLFTAGPAAYVRPVLSVAWVTVPLAGTAVLTMAVTATELGAGLTPGPGVLWTALAIAGSAITACCSVVAGMVERDETTDPATALGNGSAVPGTALLAPLAAAGILALAAFGIPSILATDYVEPALWTSFGTPSWGLLVALLTVLGACVLAPRCRPARAAALLAGAACVAALRAAELPLARHEIAGAHAGPGWWLALAAALALVVAAVLAARGTTHTPKPRSGSIR
ncbi:hypothetical protein [Amycolatopsis granulosa]|uniref:hypothetical protein n=1 Tax=Amycolatopsis granulosa TaxID=185684 RepID=UPI001422308D|nr:hypothetical protein [Amycolatopsis granulosa]NIH85577.1 hypothetical protein [Amycolatopsis granulosa]